jgi:ribulose 1,5-bisphosphate synthetase/thiazole synthase
MNPTQQTLINLKRIILESSSSLSLHSQKMSTKAPTSVIIIGAGWTSLAAAKTYLKLYPSISLTILDSDTTVGGI